jgi:hypothetical protein
MLEKYVMVYNHAKKDEANFIPAKFEIKPSNDELFIMIGI